ncbi:MAG: biopolymer transporter ExbD [Planctomycetota bacterium]|nr:MAG: biopolymer transporter ExbD [Planctomycetota bacterium]
MRIPTELRQHGLQFNITPLIDVVFLLIIFFLAASHLARNEASEPVELPEASQAASERNLPHRLVITVRADGTLIVSGRPLAAGQLDRVLLEGRATAGDRPFEVRIRADRRVPYERVEPILIACARHGIRRVGFAVLPQTRTH